MWEKSVMVPVVLLLLAAGLWWHAVSKERALTGAFEMATVLVAKEDLPNWTVVNENMVETMQVPRRYMQQDAYEIRDKSEVKLINNLITYIRIPKGNQITQSSLVCTPPLSPTEASLSPALLHYLSGINAFRSSNYARARIELKVAKRLDPSKTKIAADLKRIEQILTGGK